MAKKKSSSSFTVKNLPNKTITIDDGVYNCKDFPLLMSLFNAALANKLSYEEWLKSLPRKLLEKIVIADFIKELHTTEEGKEMPHDAEFEDIMATILYLMVYRKNSPKITFDNDDVLLEKISEEVIVLQGHALLEAHRRDGRLEYSIEIKSDNKWNWDTTQMIPNEKFFEYSLQVSHDPLFAKHNNMTEAEVKLWQKNTEEMLKDMASKKMDK